MLQVKDFPEKRCLFCNTRMSLNLGMNALVVFEPPEKIITSAGIPVITYICPSCGFVASFESEIIRKEIAIKLTKVFH
jgi:hypothetical protein